MAIPKLVYNKHEINASVIAFFSLLCVLKFHDSANFRHTLVLLFQSQDLFHNISRNPLRAVALYGQAEGKSEACSRPKEEVE